MSPCCARPSTTSSLRHHKQLQHERASLPPPSHTDAASG
uniref:Uncharacterized protein n=1 Tax=Arundo donax TaxID=35708 RepID=A0A0A9C6R2_ARUDO